jgi:osmotically-inducible protein OsmY
MKKYLTICGAIALVTLTAAPLGARPVLAGQTVAEKAAGAADKTKDAVVKTSKTVANKTKDGLSKTGEVMTDAWIVTRVNARFVDENLLKGSAINVDSADHIVTLKGTVMTRAGRTRAISVARSTEGVRRVVNRLSIGPKVG